MAVENELIYIVRLNAEGEQEVVKARRVIDETGKAATKSEKQVGTLGKQMDNAGKSTKNFRDQSSAANNALLDLTRIAQDAPYGIRGIANNLEQAALSSGRAVTQFGGVTGAIKGMASSLTGVGGVVAGITAFNLVMMGAESGLFSFGKATKDYAKDAEAMVERLSEINDELNQLKGLDDGGFFSTEGDLEALRRFSVIEEDIKDQIRELENLRNAVDLTEEQIRRARHSGRLEVGRDGEIEGVELTDEQQQQLEQYRADLEAVGGEIDNLEQKIERTERLESYPTAAAAETDRQIQELLNTTDELEEKWDQHFQKSLEDFQVDTPIIEADSPDMDTSAREREVQQEAKRLVERYQAQQKVEREIQQLQIQYARQTGEQLKAIRMQEQRDIARIRNNDLLEKEQKERAITAIERKYAQQRKDIAAQETLQKEQYEQRLLQTKLDAAVMITNALQGFGSVIAGESEENARKRFRANKAFNYAAAVMNTAAAVTKALPDPIAAAAAGAAGAVQIAKISSQKFQSGHGGSTTGGQGRVGYRGFSFSSPARQAGNTTAGRPGEDISEIRSRGKETRSIRIEDGMGNMVAKGQEEIDRGGGDNYMRRSK